MTMKPAVVEQDEMFPEGASSSTWECDDVNSGGGMGSNVDIVTSEKAVHNEFYNNFDDLFDDEDLE